MGLSTLEHENLGHADEQIARLDEQLSNLGFDSARQTPADMSRSPSWARRGLTGLILATCIGIAVVAWHRPLTRTRRRQYIHNRHLKLRPQGDTKHQVPPRSRPSWR